MAFAVNVTRGGAGQISRPTCPDTARGKNFAHPQLRVQAMANPRAPVARAKVSGADVKNPGRHKERSDPKVALLGSAPGHLSKSAARSWAMFKNELPWLAASDGALLEIAARVRGELMDGADVGVTKLSMYQSVLSKLGASPVDRSRVAIGDEDQDDPESRYFN